MQYIIGQLLGIAATVITVAIPVFRKKWQMLAATLAGNLLMAIHFFLIGQIGSAIFLYFVTMLQAKEAIEKRVKYAIQWLDELIALGAQTVWIGEGAASSSVISPACYAEFVAPYAKAVVDAARDRGIPCFMHVCGNIVPSIREIAATGCSAIDIDYMVPMALVREHCGPSACLKGNLNPVDLLTKTPEEVYDLCRQIYQETPGPMILGTGCLVAPKTPKENIDAMVRASRSMASPL